MPAKNAARYIEDAIRPLLSAAEKNWELVVIDDHSDDGTYELLRRHADRDERIRVFRNTGQGKVEGLNYGYAQSRGEVVKCIDADDALDVAFFDELPAMSGDEAHCHDAFITDEHLNRLAVYAVNNRFIKESYRNVLEGLTGLPRWAWTFTRQLGDRIFPMPASIPFEDVWFSLVIKKHATRIYRAGRPLYLYRQHGSQTFGGILNYDRAVVMFRANRMLRLIDALEAEAGEALGIEPGSFARQRAYNRLMAAENPSLVDILRAGFSPALKAKIVLIRKAPWAARLLTVVKWKMDRLFAGRGMAA